MINRAYNNTKDISILAIFAIRFFYLFFRLLCLLKKPKYVLNDLNVVLELDYKNKTFKRIYPNPSDETVKISSYDELVFNYWSEPYYFKKKAIIQSARFY